MMLVTVIGPVGFRGSRTYEGEPAKPLLYQCHGCGVGFLHAHAPHWLGLYCPSCGTEYRLREN